MATKESTSQRVNWVTGWLYGPWVWIRVNTQTLGGRNNVVSFGYLMPFSEFFFDFFPFFLFFDLSLSNSTTLSLLLQTQIPVESLSKSSNGFFVGAENLHASGRRRLPEIENFPKILQIVWKCSFKTLFRSTLEIS